MIKHLGKVKHHSGLYTCILNIICIYTHSMLAVPVCIYVFSLSTCRHLYTFMYTSSLSPHPIYHTPKSYAYNDNNYACARTRAHTHTHTHTRAHAHVNFECQMFCACMFCYIYFLFIYIFFLSCKWATVKENTLQSARKPNRNNPTPPITPLPPPNYPPLLG